MLNQALRLFGRAIEEMRSRNHHIRPVLENMPQRLRRIDGLRHYLDIRLVFEQAPDALPKQQMIVSQHATDLVF
jgi:hypothetical protein